MSISANARQSRSIDVNAQGVGLPKRPRGESGKARNSVFAGRLKYYMAERKVAPGQLAKKMGVTPETVSRWRSGKSMPDDTELLRLARLLKVEVNLLVPGFAPPEATAEPGYSSVREASTPYDRRSVEEMAADLGFNPATADPDQVLRVAGHWFAERITNERDAAKSHEWLQQVFDAGKRAGAVKARRAGTG